LHARRRPGAITPVPWRIEGIALVESKTGPRSSRYTVLKSIFPAEFRVERRRFRGCTGPDSMT
jgi:hypothetical protein